MRHVIHKIPFPQVHRYLPVGGSLLKHPGPLLLASGGHDVLDRKNVVDELTLFFD